jgi:hypothetical protein
LTDELKLRRDMERASRARSLVEDPTLKKAFEDLKQSYFNAWMATTHDQTAARERLWTATTIIAQVQKNLEVMVQDGTLAKAHLDQLAATPSQKR